MTVLAFGLLLALSVLAIIFLVVPLLKGLGYLIGGLFNGLGWLIRHVAEFITGMLADSVRFIGAIIAFVALIPLSIINVIIGRWSASAHFWRSMKRECGVGATCLYRVVLQRPLRFLLLGGLLEGLEERVNEAMEAAPTSDTPRRRTGTFDGYTIIGSLPGGGSGAKLYIAEPDQKKAAKHPGMSAQVVIKSFTISDGSSLPQIVRESRALEAAKQLGLVLDHAMDEHRFFYVMPYHEGDHLGIITRQLHGRASSRGLAKAQLTTVLGYLTDLLQTLSRYHEGGLWHKDVKPDNIIIHDNRAHIVDLGLVTPLRSAMTLTTHGTEYFRDPEMVRMALRGVKVHQVDGAKFDIYAAGAVLYFVTENTFPAHGGLSTFSKESPEAVRWIIRRAMADYHKRYESAELMLADVSYIANAPDPHAIKPAELPSMRGGKVVETPRPDVRPEPEVVVAAGSPVPPPDPAPEPTPTPEEDPYVRVYGVSIGAGGVKAKRYGAPDPRKTDTRRPNIRVTNWWTGAYQVLDPGSAAPAAGPEPVPAEATAYREQVSAMRERTSQLRQQIRGQAKSARRAAREQIREARTRARDVQRRAREHRYRTLRSARPGHPVRVRHAVAARQPSGAMAAFALLFVACLVFVGYKVINDNRGGGAHAVAIEHVLANARAELGYELGAPANLLVLNDHPDKTHDTVEAEVDRLVTFHEDLGWTIVSDMHKQAVMWQHFPTGEWDPDEPYELLREAMLDHEIGGLLVVRTHPGNEPSYQRIDVKTVLVPKSHVHPLVTRVPQLPPAPAAPTAPRAPKVRVP